MEKLKVLVVYSAVIRRRLFSEAVEGSGLGRMEHAAPNGMIALEWLKHRDIDVVLLENLLPEMSGIDTLRIIRKDYPHIEVIMISSHDPDSAAVTIKALELGAMDFILEPSEENLQRDVQYIRNQLQMLFAQIKVKKASSIEQGSTVSPSANMIAPVSGAGVEIEKDGKNAGKPVWTGANLVLIASSTGGPAALEAVCSGFPADFRKPVLVVQHMPPQFTRVLAETLDKKCMLKVVEGKEGDCVKEGQIVIAPGGVHMVVDTSDSSGKVIRLENSPYVNGVRPAADVLFGSAAKSYAGKNILAVVLTGMGSDGLKGVEELKSKCNCYCMTQSEKTCVVYGMPRSVYEAGWSDEVVELREISRRIQLIADQQGLVMG